MLPTLGRLVRYFPEDHEITNGQTVCPAVIVAVHGDGTCVNLKVFMDGQTQDLWKTSVQKAAFYGEKGRWDWPPRVG